MSNLFEVIDPLILFAAMNSSQVQYPINNPYPDHVIDPIILLRAMNNKPQVNKKTLPNIVIPNDGTIGSIGTSSFNSFPPGPSNEVLSDDDDIDFYDPLRSVSHSEYRSYERSSSKSLKGIQTLLSVRNR